MIALLAITFFVYILLLLAGWIGHARTGFMRARGVGN